MRAIVILLLLLSHGAISQVGIGSLAPSGILEISADTTGLVVPRVSRIEDVTDGNGKFAEEGTVVYDISREETCFRINGCWVCMGDNSGSAEVKRTDPIYSSLTNYIKASNTGPSDLFASVSLSSGGSRMAVGAAGEGSNANGIDGDQNDNTAFRAGAVYIFKRTANLWVQEAYIKASNSDAGDLFGINVNLSEDGTRLAVSAHREESSATGINGSQFNNSADDAGAVYIFRRTGTTWTQEAYIKASNTNADDYFGWAISLSSDGSRLAVGTPYEDSNATGINGNQSNNSAGLAGAVYMFRRTGTTWVQEAYIKASNNQADDRFGYAVDLNEDGSRLAVGASLEDSNATGVGGNPFNNSAANSGAAYVFRRSGTSWTQEAYVKASNTGGADSFGYAISLSSDGLYLAVSAVGEDSNATGINGNQFNNSLNFAGAVYIYRRNGTNWSQQAYIKASNTNADDYFGYLVELTEDGSRLAVTSLREDSNSTGLNGNQSNNSASNSGAAYVFKRNGSTWTQESFIKASNSEAEDRFGISISFCPEGCILAIGANMEDSNATGVNGDQSNNSAPGAGAVYIVQ